MNKTFKKIVSVMLVVLMCITAAPLDGFVGLDLGLDFTASAAQLQTGKVGENIFYEFDETTGEVSLTGTGKTYDYTSGNDSPFVRDSSVKSITIGEGITGIGNRVFFRCTGLTKLSLPSTLKTIGDDSFRENKLTEITIPDGVTSIGTNALRSDYNSITEIIIPDSVTSVGSFALYGRNLTKLHIGKGLTTYKDWVRTAPITTLTVSKDNPSFTAVDNVLFNKDMTTLIYAPRGITEHTIPNSITEIPYQAFYYCSSLKTVTISASTTKIGDYAFYNTALTDVYYGGTKMQWQKIEIGSNNAPLTSATIHYQNPPESQKLGDNVYYEIDEDTGELLIYGTGDMYDFTSIGDNKSPLYSNKDVKSVTIGEGVTSVGNNAFYYCAKLAKVTFPTTLKKIGKHAFESCELTSVTIPGSVETIGEFAFKSCYSLATVTISNGVKTISDNAFAFCMSLENITIPESVESIVDSAFYNCTALKAITVDENNKNYASVDGVLFNKDKTTLICYPAGKTDESYTVPAGVTTIAGKAFMCNKSIKSVTMTNDVTTLGSGAFASCWKLESITLSNKIEAIPDDAFQYNYALTSIVIPEGVKEIGESVFQECSALKTVTLPHSLQKVGDNAFAYFDGFECDYLTLKNVETVYYNACAGQKGDFANITFGENNDCVKDADVICIVEHNFGDVQHKDAACLEDGYDYKQCSICELYYASDADVKSTDGKSDTSDFATTATGHDFDDVVWTTDVSCTADGVSKAYKQCKNCKKYFDEDADTTATDGADTNEAYIIKATGHEFFNIQDEDKEPDCCSGGWYAYKCCETCEKFFPANADKYAKGGVDEATSFIRSALGHDFDFVVWTKDVSCTADGVSKAYKQCKNCKKYFGKDADTTATDGADTNEAYIIKATGHNFFVVYDKDIEPTCAYDGFYAFKQCLTCVDNFTLDADKYSTDGVDINEFIRPALGHDFEATVEVKDATCDEDGVSAAYKHCKTCNEYFDADAGERAELGEKTNEAYIIPALGHDFTGDINMDTDGKDGKHSYACINGCGEYGGTVAHTWDDGTVTTPATFNKEGLMSYYCECGATKTEPIAKISNQIGDNVFFTFDEETGALTITGTGKTYDYDNGDNCSPFEASEDIKSVTISDGVTGIGNRLFVYCYNIESVTLPDSIESIGSATFMACLSLKTLTLPSKLKTIGSFALAGTGFTSITIPASVTSIGEEAISGNSYMTEIIVSADNENYCSVDGVLFNKDKTTLICYPLAKSTEDYTVPETVTTISAGAFTYASKLKALRLPSGLKTIESEAFHPHDISDIYFDGTEEEWNNNVTVGEMNNLGDDYVTMHFKSAHNHDFTGEIKNNGDGTHSYKCTGCETYGTPVAHNAWDNGKVTTPATHLKEGVMTYTCACGETKTEPISKLKEHDYTTVNVVDPTCTEQGYTEHKCACGDSYKDTYVVAKGHHYENGKCTSCDVADPDYSDGNQSTSCSCICHNNNRFVQFIYKIVRWFWKIFKIHKSCDCGNIHY